MIFMTIDPKCRWALPAVILAALWTAGCATPPAQSGSSPEERLASIDDARRQSTDYLKGLAVAVQAEKRDDGWAVQEEVALRTSFAVERNLPHAALKSIECRSSKCSLELYLGREGSPRTAVEQQAAITHWIAVSQPCAYTMTNPATASQTMLIFLDCRR
jgi:hypothetical protein